MDESKYINQIINSGNIGILDWDLTQDRILISKALCDKLGYNCSENNINRFSAHEIIPQKDLSIIRKTIKELQSKNSTDFSLQHTLNQHDGYQCWVLHNGTVKYDNNGKPTQLIS